MEAGFILNFIMRNEEHVLQRMFDTVKNYVDVVVAVDTGSTDQSKEIVHGWNIPVVLVESQWKEDFALARNTALTYAYKWAEEHPGKTWYALFMDCDNEVFPSPHFSLPRKNLPEICLAEMRNGKTSYDYLWLLKLDLSSLWAWFYPLHETCQPAKVEGNQFVRDSRGVKVGRLSGVWIKSGRDGSRNKNPNKYLDDVRILEKYLKEHPRDLRCAYYLGQSWLDAGYPIMAEAVFDSLLKMGGKSELLFIAALRSGAIKVRRGLDPEAQLYLSRELSPERREPLYWLALHWKNKGYRQMAKDAVEKALSLPLREGMVFLDYDISVDKLEELKKSLE